MKLRHAIAVAFGLLLSACASTGREDNLTVDYNRSIARSRDEILLWNILRAAHRESLHFATVGSISGGESGTAGIELPFVGLIGGGSLSLSPTLTLEGGIDPTLSVVPLGQKEFTLGLLRPIEPQSLELFLGQGWDHSTVLSLGIAGLQCPATTAKANRVVINDGSRYDLSRELYQIFTTSTGFSVEEKPGEIMRIVSLPTQAALATLREGVGNGLVLELNDEGLARDRAGKPIRNEGAAITLNVRRKSAYTFDNLDLSHLCTGDHDHASAGVSAASLIDAGPASATPGGEGEKYVVRSPAGMIYFLGSLYGATLRCTVEDKAHRTDEFGAPYTVNPDCPDERLVDGWKQVTDADREHCRTMATPGNCLTLAKADARALVDIRTCDNVAPVDAAVTTLYRGRRYCVGRASRQTLDVLSLLGQIIALQTSEASIAAATPVIAFER